MDGQWRMGDKVFREGRWEAPPAPPSPPVNQKSLPLIGPLMRWWRSGSEYEKRQAEKAANRRARRERLPETPVGAPTVAERRRRAAHLGVWGVVGFLVACAVLITVTNVWGDLHPAAQRIEVVHEPATANSDLAAQDYAVEFAWAYLTYNSADPSAHGQALQPFLGQASDGWNQVGSQQVVDARAESVSKAGGIATVDLSALVSSTPQGGGTAVVHWLYLAVKVNEAGGHLQIAGMPTTIPPPSTTVAPQQPAGTGLDEDNGLTNQLTPAAKSLFQAWASGNSNTVSYYTVPGVTIPPLDGQVKFQSLPSFSVQKGSGTTRSSTATVVWADAVTGAQEPQSYQVAWVYNGSRWLVQSVSPGS